MRTVLIVGGHSAHGFDRKADKKGLQVLFHPAYNKKRTKNANLEH
ncbi:MAG: hypothetical protein ACE3L7_13835 [Candidatus Pristimantibacillus sp.]